MSIQSRSRNASLLMVAVLVTSLASLPAATAVHDNGMFELDGNVADAVGGGDDWASLFPTNLSSSVFASAWIAEPASNDTTYFSVSSKDINDVSTWSVSGNSAPPKDEIVNAFAAAYNSTTHGALVYFGADRWANNGDAAVGFWFLQSALTVVNGSVSGTHADNDVLVVSHFTNGGSVATIYVYKWDWNATEHLTLIATGVDCTTVGIADLACGRVNTVQTPSAVPYQGSGTKDPANQYPPRSFFEGGLNLTYLFNGAPPCFATFIAETRSSQETTAVLKDVAMGTLSTCPVVPPQAVITVEKVALPDVVDLGTNVTFGIAVTNSGPDPAENTILWDDLPALSGAWEVSGPDAAACTITGLNLTCLFGTVGVFEGRSIVLTAATGVSPGDCGLKPNTVRITANGGLANDQSSAQVYVNCSDVGVLKTVNGDPINLGSNVVFTLVVTSYGPDDANSVTLVDTLPNVQGGFTLGGDNATACSLVLAALSCDFGTLPVGQTRSITLTATPGVEDCRTLSNTATVDARVNTNASNDASTATTTVICPSLSIQKTADAASVSAGSPIGFTITVSNGGPGTATGVTLTDPLPTGTGIAWTIDPANAACGIASDTLTCAFGDLAANASASVHVTSSTAFASCGAYPNTASANATNHAIVSASNSTTVLCPDLQILKTADAASVSAGSPIGFTITVGNGGPGTATGVTLNDPLPTGAGISWTIDPANADCSIVADTLTCDFGDLAPETSASVHVTSGTSFASCADYPNTATASATNHASVNASASTTVLCPSLNIVKTADAASVSAGSPVGFTITVSNAGPGTATGVTLSDPLPGGLAWTIDPANADCSITNGTLSCDFGDLVTNASATVHVTAPTGFADCAEYPNTATASATNHAGVSDSATTTVLCPDLSLVKTADATSVSAGSPIGFTLTVSNAGPGTATSVDLTDALPTGAGISWSIDPANAACGIAADTLSCAFGDLAANASASVHVTSPTSFASCALYPNTATAGATNHPSVNASANTTVLCPDLSIVKTADAASVSAGSPIGFTITVSNAGPGTATGVTLDDPLPTSAGVVWSIDPANAACGIAADTLTCAFGDLAANASASVHVTSPTTFASCGVYDNTASASATNHPSVNDNATTTVLCPDLSILKTADAASVSAGSDIGFTITVSNAGPGTATGVTLNDPLPGGSGVSWSISPANAACGITGSPPTQTLACAFGDIAPSATVGVHVTSSTAFASCGAYPNTGSANATNHPVVSASNSTAVLCPELRIDKSADAASVSAGSPIGFTVTVSNAGPGVATDVTLDDPLPGGSGVDWSIDPANAACAITGTPPTQSLVCDFGDLAPSGSTSVHVTSATAYASCAAYPNTATASATNHANVTASATTTVLCPDLQISKTADAESVSAGSPIGFTITVWNNGPGTATGVTLNDPLPTGSGVAWTIDPANADCGIAANTLTCSFGDLAPAGSASVHVTSPTEFASCGAYPNTAAASATNHPSVQASNDTVVLCPDMSILKLAVDATVSAGSNIGFTITVENSGLGIATGVTLTDPLPGGSGIDWSLTAPSTECAITGTAPTQTLECAFGDLAPNQTASVGLVSATAYASCGAYPNTASANATNHATVTASATTTVLCPDLEIVKTADAASVSAGSDIGFTITVSNSGTGTATGVTLNDPLPTGSGIAWTIDPANAACGIAADVLTCSFGDLATNASVGVHVTSPTSFSSCAEYPNTASATATNHPTVNASASTTVLCPSLDILKTADAESVSAGSSIGFTITVSNAGPGTATDVTLDDPLPGGSGVVWSIDPANTDCSITGLAPAQTLVCDFGDIAASSSESVHVTSGTAFASCGAYPNTATASSTNHANVSSSATTTVLCPNLTVQKLADADSVSAGSPIGFTITMSNAGPGTATGVTLDDPLPTGAGLSWSIDPASADCAIANGTLECDFGDLAANASESVHVTSPTSFASCAEYSNTAGANATNHVGVLSTDTTTVLCPDLSLLKTADAANVTAGSPIGFTLTVENSGLGVATDVTLMDALPGGSGINWTIDPMNADCLITGSAPNQTLACDFGDTAAGANASVHVTSATTNVSCGDYPNFATVGATNHANVSASNSTTVECPRIATRTQGFWSTHTAYTQRVFDEALGGTMTVGQNGHTRIIDDDGKLFGAWLSSVSQKTTGQKRSPLDHARMVLLQQLVTAKLNCAAFTCPEATWSLIAAADAAYAGGNKGLMSNLTAQLDAYNNGGDDVALPAIYGPWNPATPDLSAAIANRVFWNTP